MMVFTKLMKVTSTALKKPITLVCVFLTLFAGFLTYDCYNVFGAFSMLYVQI